MTSSLTTHVSDSEADTAKVATDFADALMSLDVRPVVVYLTGELGAGKSVFARSLLRRLGVKSAIKSPTYTLVEQYEIADAAHDLTRCAHLDLYRMTEPDELYFIGFDDILAASDLLLIEWPEKGAGQLPSATHHVTIEYRSKARQLSIRTA